MRFEGCRRLLQMEGFVGSGREEDESEDKATVSQVLYDRIGYAGP